MKSTEKSFACVLVGSIKRVGVNQQGEGEEETD